MSRNTSLPDARSTMRVLRERQREERAALILAVAQQVFTDKGYYDASIDEIAAHAGVAKGTVYLHFASKEDLLVALVEQQLRGFLVSVEEVSAKPLPVRERLEQILLDVYTRMHEQRNQVLLDLNASLGLTTNIIAKHADLQVQQAQTLERIAALIEEGKRTGELDLTVPTPIMLATFVTLISPSGYQSLLTSGQVSPAALMRYVSRTFFPSSGASSPTEVERSAE